MTRPKILNLNQSSFWCGWSLQTMATLWWLSLRASFGSWSLAGRYIMVLIETGLFTSADPAACCHHKSWPALTQRSHRLRIARPPHLSSLWSISAPQWIWVISQIRLISKYLQISRYLLFLCLIIFYVRKKNLWVQRLFFSLSFETVLPALPVTLVGWMKQTVLMIVSILLCAGPLSR